VRPRNAGASVDRAAAEETMQPRKNTVVARETLSVRGPSGLRAAARPRTFELIYTTQVDPYDPPVKPAEVIAERAAMRAVTGDLFTGKSRKPAKITIAKAPLEKFDDLKDLIATLPKESAMKNHSPKIGQGPTSGRVVEEERNVRVKAWLWAHSVEGDRDFHLILGREPGKQKLFLTMEVSGLPPASSPHRKRIERARKSYKNLFKGKLPGTGYVFVDPPMPLEIGGSLFFDIKHLKGGRPGPPDLRPDIPTVWEVHPVTHIKLRAGA
jgi:hypothetical protein